MSKPTRPLPLAGVRVLDISQVMAGPYACMLLGDLGADVIKIEPPGTGDQTRGSMGFKMKGADSLGFLNMNRNKRSVTLDLKSEAGKEVLKTLAAEADILVENYRPGALKRLGIGYDVLKEINPRLVYTSISGFGQTGPWADRPGFDLMAQAMSGVMSVTGYPDSPPVKAGVPVADIGCALFAIYFFHAHSFWESMRHAEFWGATWRAFTFLPVYKQVAIRIARACPALALILPVTLVTFAVWRRTRYFGNTAPLLGAGAFIGLAIAHPHTAGTGFLLAAIPFIFIFVSGVLADLIETKYRAVILACILDMVVTYVARTLMALAQVPPG